MRFRHIFSGTGTRDTPRSFRPRGARYDDPRSMGSCETRNASVQATAVRAFEPRGLFGGGDLLGSVDRARTVWGVRPIRERQPCSDLTALRLTPTVAHGGARGWYEGWRGQDCGWHGARPHGSSISRTRAIHPPAAVRMGARKALAWHHTCEPGPLRTESSANTSHLRTRVRESRVRSRMRV